MAENQNRIYQNLAEEWGDGKLSIVKSAETWGTRGVAKAVL